MLSSTVFSDHQYFASLKVLRGQGFIDKALVRSGQGWISQTGPLFVSSLRGTTRRSSHATILPTTTTLATDEKTCPSRRVKAAEGTASGSPSALVAHRNLLHLLTDWQSLTLHHLNLASFLNSDICAPRPRVHQAVG
jgi:hypothetical protein